MFWPPRNLLYCYVHNRDASTQGSGTVQTVVSRLQAGQLRNRELIADASNNFLFITTSWLALLPIHPPPLQWVPGAASPGIKWLGQWTDPSSTEIKNELRCTSTFPYALMACTGMACLVCHFNEEDCQNHVQYWSVWVVSSITGCNVFLIDTNI